MSQLLRSSATEARAGPSLRLYIGGGAAKIGEFWLAVVGRTRSSSLENSPVHIGGETQDPTAGAVSGSTAVSTNKMVRMINERGESFAYSAEELMARGLNRWRGWHCTAGVENLYVTHDGSIYGAVCREGGYIGNVFEVNFYARMKYVKCSRRYCTCGTDMALRKFKRLKNRWEAYQLKPTDLEVEPARDYVAVRNFFQDQIPPKQVLWDLGRRCNYACSYCPPATSNRFEAHKTLGSLTQAMNNIERSFLKGDLAKFIFGGGEPTLNPDFLDFVKYVYSLTPKNRPQENHWIHVTTNGSRLPEYYLELLRYAGLTFSVHFEFAQMERFLEVIRVLVAAKAQDRQLAEEDRQRAEVERQRAAKESQCGAVERQLPEEERKALEQNRQRPEEQHHLQWRYLGIRIMVQPGNGPQAEDLLFKLRQIPHFAANAVVNVSPVLAFSPEYDTDFESAVPNTYSETERSLFD